LIATGRRLETSRRREDGAREERGLEEGLDEGVDEVVDEGIAEKEYWSISGVVGERKWRDELRRVKSRN